MSQQKHSNACTSFVLAAHEMLGDSSLSAVVSWDETGTSFEIKAVAAFSAVALPRFFRHANLSSFLRQLNLFGFRKEPGRHCYSHPEFFRGGREMLRKMKRTLVKSQAPQFTDTSIYHDLRKITTQLATLQRSESQGRSTQEHEASMLKEMSGHLDEAIRLLASYPDQHWRTEDLQMRPREDQRSQY